MSDLPDPRMAQVRGELAARTWLALVHHPVLNRNQEVVTTAVTNLDIHDIARSSRTFGLAGYLLVTPIERQRLLVERIVSHWRGEYGQGANRNRAEAISLIRVVEDLDAAVAAVTAAHGREPMIAATAARAAEDTMAASDFVAHRLADDRPTLLLFGTGWGLADGALTRAEIRLDPIRGPTDYNHLSVRSAVSIYLDRLFGL